MTHYLHGLEGNIVKMSVLHKIVYRFNVIPIKISLRFSVDIDKLTLKFTWKDLGSRIAKTILTKKNNS